LKGDLPRKGLAQEIILNTRRYAKRQETWFRHQLKEADTLTLNSTVAPADLARQIVDHWNQRKDS
jgi:tRNA A37 N6-isopentenylltransferase MiaA